MKRLPILLWVLPVLAGCATPVVSTLGTRDVAIKVTEPCIDPKDIPPIPKTALRPDADIAARAAGAEADVRELRRLARRQNALLQGCANLGGK
jgi:hypothetical protein